MEIPGYNRSGSMPDLITASGVNRLRKSSCYIGLPRGWLPDQSKEG